MSVIENDAYNGKKTTLNDCRSNYLNAKVTYL